MKIIRSVLFNCCVVDDRAPPSRSDSFREEENHSIGERPSSRYAGFCIPVDEERD